MSKLLYSSIVFGVGLFVSGIPNNAELTVKAEELSVSAVEITDKEVSEPVEVEKKVKRFSDQEIQNMIAEWPKQRLKDMVGNAVNSAIIDEDNLSFKEQQMYALGKEGASYLQGYEKGYGSVEGLQSYNETFSERYHEIVALEDDAKYPGEDNWLTENPTMTTVSLAKSAVIESEDTNEVVKSDSSATNEQKITRTSTIKKHRNNTSNEVLPSKVVTTHRAVLYTDEGNVVTNRCLSDKSTWHVDKCMIILGQKMYRISANEWVAESDVI